VFEEKFISPLAIRFAQERIKTVFRDGRSVDASLAQIETRPGKGEYELILHVPFPAIEVVRWLPRSASDGNASGHWFSFDNRRLYCLQKAAIAYWPRNVGVQVEVLYDDPGRMRRKFDSETMGLSVSIGRCLEEPLFRWSWQEQVSLSCTHLSAAEKAAADSTMALVDADDQKCSVHDLLDVPQVSRLLQSAAQDMSICMSTDTRINDHSDFNPGCGESSARCATPSTKLDSESSEASSDRDVPCTLLGGEGLAAHLCIERTPLDSLSEALIGSWEDSGSISYKVKSCGELCWACVRHDHRSTKKFVLSYEQDSGLVWWGNAKTHFLDPAQLANQRNTVFWYAAGSRGKRRPRFVWHRPAQGCCESASTCDAESICTISTTSAGMSANLSTGTDDVSSMPASAGTKRGARVRARVGAGVFAAHTSSGASGHAAFPEARGLGRRRSRPRETQSSTQHV